MNVHEELVKVRNALNMCGHSLDLAENAAAMLGLVRLSDTLNDAVHCLAVQRQVLHEIAGKYATEKFNEAQAASASVLHAVLAGAEMGSREEERRLASRDLSIFAEREM